MHQGRGDGCRDPTARVSQDVANIQNEEFCVRPEIRSDVFRHALTPQIRQCVTGCRAKGLILVQGL